MAVFWVAEGDMTTLGDGGWKGWGKKIVPNEYYFFDGSTQGRSCSELAHSTPCNSSCVISKNALPLWFHKSFLC